MAAILKYFGNNMTLETTIDYIPKITKYLFLDTETQNHSFKIN